LTGRNICKIQRKKCEYKCTVETGVEEGIWKVQRNRLEYRGIREIGVEEGIWRN